MLVPFWHGPAPRRGCASESSRTCTSDQQTKGHNFDVCPIVVCSRCRRFGSCLWTVGGAFRPVDQRRYRAHARNRRCRAGRCPGLFEPPVHDDRRGRRRHLRCHRTGPWAEGRNWVPDRGHPVGRGGLSRHEHLGALQRAHNGSRQERPGAGAEGRLSGRIGHRHARRRAGAAGGHRLLRGSAVAGRRATRAHRIADRAQLRRLAHLHLRAPRRRHLHQGRRRRRRFGRQGRGRHSRRRPAQSGGHRRQCRRQCRRLRRHGGRFVRDLRRHRGRDNGVGVDRVQRRGGGAHAALPAGHWRYLHCRLGHRHVLRAPRRQSEHHGCPL